MPDSRAVVPGLIKGGEGAAWLLRGPIAASSLGPTQSALLFTTEQRNTAQPATTQGPPDPILDLGWHRGSSAN